MHRMHTCRDANFRCMMQFYVCLILSCSNFFNKVKFLFTVVRQPDKSFLCSLLLSFKNYGAKLTKVHILCFLIWEVQEALEASFDDTSFRSFIFPDSPMCWILPNLITLTKSPSLCTINASYKNYAWNMSHKLAALPSDFSLPHQ